MKRVYLIVSIVAGVALIALAIFVLRMRNNNSTSPPSPSGCVPPCTASHVCISGACIPSTCTPPCTASQICISGTCVTDCVPPCSSTQACVDGKCVTPQPTCTPPCTAPLVCVNNACVTPTSPVESLHLQFASGMSQGRYVVCTVQQDNPSRMMFSNPIYDGNWRYYRTSIGDVPSGLYYEFSNALYGATISQNRVHMNNTSLTDVHLDLEALPNSNLVAISALSAGSSNKIYVTSVALDHSLVFSTAAQSAAMSFNALVV